MNVRLYHERRSNGLCTTCGCVMPEGWIYVQCEECRLKLKGQYMEKSRQRKAACEELAKQEAEASKSKPKKRESVSLDKAAVEAKNNGMSYAEMQKAELIKRMRESSI